MDEDIKLKLIQRMSYLQKRLTDCYITEVEKSILNKELSEILKSLADMLAFDVEDSEKVIATSSVYCLQGKTSEVQTNVTGTLDESKEFIPVYLGYNPYLKFETVMSDDGLKIFVKNAYTATEGSYVRTSILGGEELGYLMKSKNVIKRKLTNGGNDGNK